MALSHSETSGNFPSDALVQQAMCEARSRWPSRGFDAAMCTRLERRLKELATSAPGRFFLVNKGMNGYWTNALATFKCDSNIGNAMENHKYANESEELLAQWFSEIRGEQELLLRDAIRPLLKPGFVVASVPSGLMSEVLMAAEHFEGVQLYAIDIDKANFEHIREKYGDRLVGNEFHPIEMNALTLDIESKFDLITCVGFSMYVKQDLMFEFISRIHRALKPGGRLLFTFFPDPSEQSPLYPLDVSRNHIAREVYMCTEIRFATRPLTSSLLKLFSQAGFVHININGGKFYQLALIDARKIK